jgi:hypothetical protein
MTGDYLRLTRLVEATMKKEQAMRLAISQVVIAMDMVCFPPEMQHPKIGLYEQNKPAITALLCGT